MMRKNFIPKNESFTCKKCGEKNPEAKPSYRNHCRKCLWSLHVDEDVPGDRGSSCGALMEPVAAEKERILHRCTACEKEMWNKLLSDDDHEMYIKVSLCSPQFRKSWKNM